MLGFDRITFDPNVMAGKACIRGMRVTVSLLLNLVANGMDADKIVAAYHTWRSRMFISPSATPHGRPDQGPSSLHLPALAAEDRENRMAKREAVDTFGSSGRVIEP